jgi:uncharacterized protein DUF2125
MRFRRWVWIVSVGMAILLGAATFTWYLTTRHLMQGFAEWQANLREAGWQVDAGKPAAGGWPFAATVTIPAVAVGDRGRMVPGGIDWHAADVRLRISAWHPRTLVVSLHGRQSLAIRGEGSGYAAEWMALSIPLGTNSTTQSADIAVTRLRFDDGGIESLHALLMFGSTAAPDGSAVGISLRADAITLVGEAARPLGSRIPHLRLEATLSGTLTPNRDPRATAAIWHASGGALHIRDFQVLWGPLDLTASGTVGLDDNLQPDGDANAHAIGYAETLDALATHGIMTRAAATAAKAVLSLLANYPANGGAPSVDVPLALKNSTLAMHQVPLMRLPQIVWP